MAFVQGPGTRGGRGGTCPLESRIYRVKFLKIGKISIFLLAGPPLGKNRSHAPVNETPSSEESVALLAEKEVQTDCRSTPD